MTGEIRVTAYFDCNATTPVDPRVLEEMLECLKNEPGNAGSPHGIGQRAKALVQRARDQIGQVVGARRHEIVFTSGATESNNLALLGLADHGMKTNRRHIVSTQIEHKAVLEPLERLARQGFEVTLVAPDRQGRVAADDIQKALRDDTLLVSLMHANNETGVLQPIAEVADFVRNHDAFLHVDAAQGFGKELEPLRHPGIDLISISGHKIYAPQGIGALVLRRREFALPPLTALQVGGGQELGMRSGTLPVHLIVGLGKAAELAMAEADDRKARCLATRQQLLSALASLQPQIHGHPEFTQEHVVNISFPGVDAELAMEALEPVVAVSNGAACTTICDTASHVLLAMQLDRTTIDEALRLSWYHDSELPDLARVVEILQSLRHGPDARSVT